MESINFEEVLIAGSLFEEKLMNHYYKLYAGELSRHQAHALALICDNPGLLSKDIAVMLDVPKQYASKIILRLLEEDLIEAGSNPKDTRKQPLSPTEKGRLLLSAHVQKSNLDFSKKLEALSANEQEQLLSAFSSLRMLLEKF